MNNIMFNEEILKKYPLLSKMKEGIDCIYLADTIYVGTSCEVIAVSSDENGNPKIEISLGNPHYKEVTIDDLSVVAFEVDESNGYQLLNGQLVCPWCSHLITHIEETQYDYISWDWDTESMSYIKKDSTGDTNYPRCSHCDSRIESDSISY